MLGALLGVLGLVLFVTATPDTVARAVGFASGGAAIALLLFGPIVRLPLSRTATRLAAVGVLICAAAILYFFAVYPQDWGRPNGNLAVVLTYAGGVVLILLAGVAVPLVAGRAERDLEAV